MTNFTIDTESDDFKEGCRQYAIELMRQRQDIFEDDLFMSEMIDDTEVDDEKD